MGGSICLWYLQVFSMHWYFLISSYCLTVSNGCSLTVLKSVEVTQHSGSFKWGGSSGRFTLNLPFPYIFLLFDCFEWALIDRIEKCRVHSVLWQFRMGGGGSIGRFTLNLPFPYIFLLFDCFEWVLTDRIEKRRVHSALWQFRMGGGQLADLP